MVATDESAVLAERSLDETAEKDGITPVSSRSMPTVDLDALQARRPPARRPRDRVEPLPSLRVRDWLSE
jgi:hypothetical protein